MFPGKTRSGFSIKIAAALFGVLLAGTALAQFPQGQQTGASPQTSGALVTLALPSVVGVSAAHNYVLDFSSGTKCWGSGSTQGTFPQAVAGTTIYTFAVSATSIASSANVACPGAGSQSDVGAVQVFSTSASNSRLQVGIVDGGQGAQATAFTGLIPDIYSAARLKSATVAGTCGGGTIVTPHTMTVAASNVVTAIPATGWSDCNQTLSLTLAAATPVSGGTATGTMTFTIVNP
jgi:hypothetical protein